MPIPNAHLAYVPVGKSEAYLLSLAHPVGAAKARFFQRLGFDAANAEIFEEALVALAQSSEVASESSPYGIKYRADGLLLGPSGRAATVRTVWLVEPQDPRPRLVTAYPI